MTQTFYFYDLETTGVNPRKDRVMQFAGQRTDTDLNPIGEPHNILIKLTEDVLPSPDAIMITGITPQKTLEEGITEAEFCKFFMEEIVQPGTCFLGYNSIRFDDEFMRFLLYRNFYDPYAWQWKDGTSRWDMLDVVRMTRALRPGDIKWPVTVEGVGTNRLELITAQNNLNHEAAHDALSDVYATIAVAKMIKDAQPKLFEYLYNVHSKKDVAQFLANGKPFVYTSGRYASEHDKTTVVHNLGPHPENGGILVYDLRHDPTQFLKMDVDELVACWKYNPDREAIKLPVKAMQLNRAPAIAPLDVLKLDNAGERLKIDETKIKEHLKSVVDEPDFYSRLCKALEKMNQLRADQSALFSANKNPDQQLYDGFIPNPDRKTSEKIVTAKPDQISEYASKLEDLRLKGIAPLYKARNYPEHLTDEERAIWDEHRNSELLLGAEKSNVAVFNKRLAELAAQTTTNQKSYLIEELRLYAESIMPESY